MLYNTCQPVRLSSSSHQEAVLNPKIVLKNKISEGNQLKNFVQPFVLIVMSDTYNWTYTILFSHRIEDQNKKQYDALGQLFGNHLKILFGWNSEKLLLKYNILSSQLDSYTGSPSYLPFHKGM